MKEQLNQDKTQAILDNYSLGKVTSVLTLSEVLVHFKENLNLSRCLAETNQGLYLLAYGPNDELHSMWWSSESSDFASMLSNSMKLKNAKLLLTNQNTTTVHKFGLRISVFLL